MTNVFPGGVRQVAQAVRTGTYTRPKTVLAYFWGFTAVVITGAVFGVRVLSDSNRDEYIGPLLLFAGLMVIVSFVTVVVAMFKDPTKLMLGEMSGGEYTAYRALTLGDSLTGERIEHVPISSSSSPTALPPAGGFLESEIDASHSDQAGEE